MQTTIAQTAANTGGLVGLAVLGLTVVFLWRVVEGGHKASNGGSFIKGLVPVFLAIATLGAYKAGTLFSSIETTGAQLYSFVAATITQSLPSA